MQNNLIRSIFIKQLIQNNLIRSLFKKQLIQNNLSYEKQLITVYFLKEISYFL